jgi:hypothetical protein
MVPWVNVEDLNVLFVKVSLVQNLLAVAATGMKRHHIASIVSTDDGVSAARVPVPPLPIEHGRAGLLRLLQRLLAEKGRNAAGDKCRHGIELPQSIIGHFDERIDKRATRPGQSQ